MTPKEEKTAKDKAAKEEKAAKDKAVSYTVGAIFAAIAFFILSIGYVAGCDRLK